jgi:hypothetical protein
MATHGPLGPGPHPTVPMPGPTPGGPGLPPFRGRDHLVTPTPARGL